MFCEFHMMMPSILASTSYFSRRKVRNNNARAGSCATQLECVTTQYTNLKINDVNPRSQLDNEILPKTYPLSCEIDLLRVPYCYCSRANSWKARPGKSTRIE